MKILFIQKYIFSYAGIMAISGYVKQKGHDCSVLIDSLLKNKKLLIKEIKAQAPDTIAFSLMSTDHSWFVDIIQVIKKEFPKIPIIAGGVHVILYSNEIISIPEVDVVCTAEGEITTLQYLEYLAGKRTLDEVLGIAYKKNREIIRTKSSPLIEDLDSFTEDREVYYDDYKTLKDLPLKVFFSSRGCPYKCSFCINHHLQDRFRDLGKYVRRKSVQHFIKEIKNIKDKYGMKFIFCADDLFAYNIKWLEDFAEKYKKEIDIPFICTCRADRLTEEVVKCLAKAGCHSVSFGVETGNEKLRHTVLNKKITDEQLVNAGRLLTKYKLEYQTSNMFGLPGETFEDGLKTIDLNIKIGAKYTMSAIFLPFPKTKLADLCIEMGLLKPDYSFDDMPSSFITHSVLKQKDTAKLERQQKVASLMIQYPKLRNILAFAAKNIPFYPLFFALYLVGTVLRFREERKLSIWETLKYLWSYRKNV